MLRMAEHFSTRAQSETKDRPQQITRAFQLSTGRRPSPDQLSALTQYEVEYGMENLCRLILNLNEFVFVD
jgi:hypothetical protein